MQLPSLEWVSLASTQDKTQGPVLLLFKCDDPEFAYPDVLAFGSFKNGHHVIRGFITGSERTLRENCYYLSMYAKIITP